MGLMRMLGIDDKGRAEAQAEKQARKIFRKLHPRDANESYQTYKSREDAYALAAVEEAINRDFG